MASAPQNSALTCPNCRATNPPGAVRCGVCGAPLAPAAQWGAPPGYPPQGYAPPPAYAAPAARPLVAIDAPLNEALARALGALQAAGCQITGQPPPGGAGPGAVVNFVKPYSEFSITVGMTVRYNGVLTITPESDRRSAAAIQLTLDTGSAVPTFLILGAMGLVVFLFISALFGAIALGVAMWFLWSRLNGAALNAQIDLIAAQLGGPPGYGVPPGYAPPPGYYPPPPFTPGR